MRILDVSRVVAVVSVLMSAAITGATACSSTSDSSSASATRTIGVEGGRITLDDVVLDIPPSALAGSQSITITRTNDPPPPGYAPASALYRFEPTGLVFSAPATVTMGAASAAPGASIVWSEGATGYEPLATSLVDGRAQAKILHFSHGFLGTPRCEHAPTCDVESAECSFFETRCGGPGATEKRQTCLCAGGAWRCNASTRSCGEQVDAGTDAGLDAASDAMVADAGPWVPPGSSELVLSTLYSCALADGGAMCAGSNIWADFGNGASDDAGSIVHPMEPAASGLTLTTLSTAGSEGHCGLTSDGTAYCWGANDQGQIGPSSLNGSCGNFGCVKTPIEELPGTKFASISAGRDVTCALVADGGSAWCWGAPPQISANAAARNIAGPWARLTVGPGGSAGCGSYQDLICALDTSGEAYCWGSDNCRGELGTGSDAGMSKDAGPVKVSGEHTWQTISAGAWGACAIDVARTVFCWGLRRTDQVPSASGIDYVPVAIALPAGKLAADVRHGTFSTCALTTSGEVYCWGSNRYGALGQGTVDTAGSPTEYHATPELVSGLPPIRAISVEDFGACALAVSGERYCWGHNGYGRFGNGSTADVPTATKMP